MWRFRALESHLQTFELTWVERRTKFAITRVDWALWIACIAKREWWIKVLMRLSFSQFERAGVSSPDHSLAWFERSTVWFSFFSSSKWGPRINEGNLYCFSAHSARRQDGPGRASGVDLGLAKIDWEDQDSNKWAAGRSNSRLNWIVIQFAELIKAIWNLNCIQVEWNSVTSFCRGLKPEALPWLQNFHRQASRRCMWIRWRIGRNKSLISLIEPIERLVEQLSQWVI